MYPGTHVRTLTFGTVRCVGNDIVAAALTVASVAGGARFSAGGGEVNENMNIICLPGDRGTHI